MQGKLLRDIRKAIGLNQSELGKLVGYGQQQLSKMEGGKVKVPPGVLLACEALLERKRNERALDEPVQL